MNRLSRSHHPYTRPSRGSGADIGQITHRGITIFRRATSPTSSPQYFHLSSQYCGDVGTSVNAKVVTPEDFFFYPLRPFFPSFLLPSFSFSLFSTVKWPLKSSQEVWGALLDPFSGGENNICSHQTRFQGSKYISKRILVYLEPRLLQISSHFCHMKSNKVEQMWSFFNVLYVTVLSLLSSFYYRAAWNAVAV